MKINLTGEIRNGRLVFPVQYEIEDLAMKTGQGHHVIYFDIVWLDQSQGVGLKWNGDEFAWELVKSNE